MKIRLKTKYCDGDAILHLGQYTNGRLAIRCISNGGIPILTATVNLPERELPADHIFLKSYAENEGLIECFIREKLVRRTYLEFAYNYVMIQEVKMADKLLNFIKTYELRDL